MFYCFMHTECDIHFVFLLVSTCVVLCSVASPITNWAQYAEQLEIVATSGTTGLTVPTAFGLWRHWAQKGTVVNSQTGSKSKHKM